MLTHRRLSLVLVGTAVAGAVTGCGGGDAAAPVSRVVVCWGTERPSPAGGIVVYSFVQDGEQVATASGPVDAAFGVDVPAGKVTTVLVDGEVFGEAGSESDAPPDVGEDNRVPGFIGITGRGCPDPGSVGNPPN